jgi:small subunit ribosomal protein S10
MPKKDEQVQKERLRIKVKAYDTKLIDNSVKQIVEAIKRQGGDVTGPIPLPTEFKRYTVNRSTFVHKKSREQFELRVHKRLVDIMNPEQKIIESLTELNLPSGVDVEIKMM